jgi:CHAD domain-containing protein
MVAGTTTYRPAAPAPDAATALDVLERAGLISAAPATSTIAVLDTFDGRIADAGLRLELVDGRQLTLRGEGVVAAGVTVAAQPRSAEDVSRGPLRGRLARLLDVRALLRLVEVTSERVDAELRNGSGKVTVAAAVHKSPSANGVLLDDSVLVEVHELAGYAKAAAELRGLVESAGFVAVDGGLTDLAAASAGVPLGGFDVPVGVPLAADDSALDGFRAVLANLHDAMLANWDGVVADVDPEFLHDLRVAVRRTRVVLGNAKRVLPEEVRQRTREDFAWIGAISGTARDLDVYQIEWPEYTAALDDTAAEALIPLREHLGVERQAAHVELAAQLSSARAAEVVETWSNWLGHPVDTAALGDRSLEALPKTVRRRIRRAHGAMVDRGRSITPATPADTVHELRKDAKKLRYLIECFGGLYDKAPRTAFVGRLKALQDTLGEHQDAEVHAHALRTIADDPRLRWSADTLLAIGQLIERLEQRRLASRNALAERFAEFDRNQTTSALKELLASAKRDDS